MIRMSNKTQYCSCNSCNNIYTCYAKGYQANIEDLWYPVVNVVKRIVMDYAKWFALDRNFILHH